jgi:anti-sigma regulatory factor (Ser/Thr protein kinase)
MGQNLKVSGPVEPAAVGVTHLADVKRVQEAARKFAKAAGFSSVECEEIVLVSTELASNLIKHAGGGTLNFNLLESGDRRGIQIESEDHGPGIADVELAMSDGYSTAGSLGTGLGTVNRLMDQLDFSARSQAGLRILCQRWQRPSRQLSVKWLEIGAATRPYHLLPENGDALVSKQWNGNALVGVIDGLGHGRFAQKASHAAREYVERHFDQPLENLFRGVSRACRATRGVVMTLGRFDLARQTVALASIGNVETRLIGVERPRVSIRRGVLGLNAPNPVVCENAWTPNSVLVIHSDGLRTRWQWNEFEEIAQEPPAVIARHLLNKLGKQDDDATVLVVKNAAS